MNLTAQETSPMQQETLQQWVSARWSTLRMILVGSLSYPIVFFACWKLWPEVAPIAAPVDRVLFALQLCVAPAAILFWRIFACMRLMDTPGAENPFAGAESHKWKLNSRVLQNTLEQAAIFIPVLLGLAVRLNPAHLKLLPILVTIWCVGRVLFWAGIHKDLTWRAVGFDWTFYSSGLGLGWFVFTLF